MIDPNSSSQKKITLTWSPGPHFFLSVSSRMSRGTPLKTFVAVFILLLNCISAQEDLFTDFISNVLVDNQFSDAFFSELLASKYVFQQERKFNRC